MFSSVCPARFRMIGVLCGLLPLVGFALLTPAWAVPAIPEKIDAFVRTEMERQQIPGLAVAVLQHGKITFQGAYGFSNLEHRVPVRAETVFQSGSVAKQFTATAVMMLVQEGRLALDDTLSRHFPDAPASWSKITVRHLLAHTSGMADYPKDFDLQRDHTEDEMLAIIKAAPLTFAPGERWDYSNLGYVTLGILIRKVTGQFYGDFLAERVFRPLGMTTARVISEADIIPNRAASYRLVNGELKNIEWVSPTTNTTADGSLYFTILDLARWDAALYTDTPLPRATLAQMWTPATLNNGQPTTYGFGWATEQNHGHRTVYHGGFWQGFKSMIVRLPDEGLTILLLANSASARELRLARGLLAIYRPKFALPAEKVIADQERPVTRKIKALLLQLSVGETDRTLFTPDAQAELFPAQAAQMGVLLNTLNLPIEVIHEAELVERREKDGVRHYRYMLTDLGKTVFCTVQMTKDDKIAGLQLTRE